MARELSISEIEELGVQSGKMRKKFGLVSKGKRVLLNDRETAKYVGYVLGVGRKG